jgi:hypothetical protein
MPSEIIKLAGFKQTYCSGHHLSNHAEPALGFLSTQSPNAAINLLGSTTGKLARGRLRSPRWLTDAAALTSDDLIEREVYVTPALKEIHSMLEAGDRE